MKSGGERLSSWIRMGWKIGVKLEEARTDKFSDDGYCV